MPDAVLALPDNLLAFYYNLHRPTVLASRRQASTGIALALFQRLLDQWRSAGTVQQLESVLRAAGTNVERLTSSDASVRLFHYYLALRRAAPLLGHTGFFLRLGRSYDIFDLGIIGYALISAVNLRRSWDISLGDDVRLLPHPIKTHRRIDDDYATIILTPPTTEPLVTRALCEEWLASSWRWICQRLPDLTRNSRMQVQLHYPAPTYSALYKDIFPGHVRFGMTQSALMIPSDYYEKPFSSSNTSVARLCYEHSLASMDEFTQHDTLVDEVRFFLLSNATIPFPSLEETAVKFNMPIHTLQRRLLAAGQTFRRVTLETRMVLARQYLRQTELSIQEISYRTGYRHAASFCRAFAEWHEQSAQQYRINARTRLNS